METYEKAVGLYNDKKYDEALPLFEKAASVGYAPAQFMCGGMYLEGLGAERDTAKALVWFEKAAAQGHAAAQFFCEKIKSVGEAAEK